MVEKRINRPAKLFPERRLRWSQISRFGLIVLGLLITLSGCGSSSSSNGGEGTQVNLAWDPPTLNSEGDPLTDLFGFRIYEGMTPGDYTMIRT